MKLLLTGGTGFFGRSLLRHWIRQRDQGKPVPEVCLLSRYPVNFVAVHPEFSQLPWLRLIQGDIRIPETLPRREKFSHILHAAADSTLGPALAPIEQYDQIVQGTRNLLDFAAQIGARRFLFISSGAVYGKQPAQVSYLSEDWLGMPDPLLPSSTYGVAKRAAEHLCALYQQANGLETIVARCFAFVGPDLPLNVHFAIGNFIRDALSSDEIIVQGNGTPLRSYLDQQDLAHWLLTIMDHGKSGAAYNVGSDRAICMADLAHMVRDLVAPSKSVQIMGLNDDSKDRSLYIPSIEKVRREFGLMVTVKLEDAIRATALSVKNRQ